MDQSKNENYVSDIKAIIANYQNNIAVFESSIDKLISSISSQKDEESLIKNNKTKKTVDLFQKDLDFNYFFIKLFRDLLLNVSSRKENYALMSFCDGCRTELQKTLKETDNEIETIKQKQRILRKEGLSLKDENRRILSETKAFLVRKRQFLVQADSELEEINY